jgi:hypothetical protein
MVGGAFAVVTKLSVAPADRAVRPLRVFIHRRGKATQDWANQPGHSEPALFSATARTDRYSRGGRRESHDDLSSGGAGGALTPPLTKGVVSLPAQRWPFSTGDNSFSSPYKRSQTVVD